MRILYLDCLCGVGIRRLLGALTGLVDDFHAIEAEVSKLKIHGLYLTAQKTVGSHSPAYEAEFYADEVINEAQEMFRRLEESCLKEKAKKIGGHIFQAVLDLNDEIEEEGIFQIFLCAVTIGILIEILEVDLIVSSPIKDGQGPEIPSRGILMAMSKYQMKTVQAKPEKELCDLAGVTAVGVLAHSYGTYPEMNIFSMAYGSDEKGVCRVILGENSMTDGDSILVMETNLDDCTGEVLGYTMERLFDAGAKDVFYTSIQMKKNRPAYQLTVLCDPKDGDLLEKIIFLETSTIGIRKRVDQRTILPRSFCKVNTVYGKMDVKKAVVHDRIKYYPEYETAKKLAQENGVSVKEIYDALTIACQKEL